MRQLGAKDLQLTVIQLQGETACYQAIALSTRTPGSRLSTQVLEAWQLPPGLDRDRGVVLYGSAPVWLYAYGVGQLAAFPWVGIFSLRETGIVVVSSRVTSVRPGDFFPVALRSQPGVAILVGGPPNSGKSVLCNSLRLAIARHRPETQVYLHRANWDGEGNYIYESPHREVVRQLKQRNKYPIPDLPNAEDVLRRYFIARSRDTMRIRRAIDVTLVDVGGVPDAVKRPVAQACSHLLVISRDASQVAPWLGLCEGLETIAIVESVREDTCEVLETSPCLRVRAGAWERERPPSVPAVLLEAVLRVVDGKGLD